MTTLPNGFIPVDVESELTEAMGLNQIMSGNTTTPNIENFDDDYKKPITDKHTFHISFGLEKGYYKCDKQRKRISVLSNERVNASFLLEGKKMQIAVDSWPADEMTRKDRNWFMQDDHIRIYMKTLDGGIIEVEDAWSKTNLYYPILTVGDAKRFYLILPTPEEGRFIPYRPTPAISESDLQVGKTYYIDTTHMHINGLSTTRCQFVGIFIERYWMQNDDGMSFRTALIFRPTRKLFLGAKPRETDESVSDNKETIQVIAGDNLIIKPIETISDQNEIDPIYARTVKHALYELPEDIQGHISDNVFPQYIKSTTAKKKRPKAASKYKGPKGGKSKKKRITKRKRNTPLKN